MLKPMKPPQILATSLLSSIVFLSGCQSFYKHPPGNEGVPAPKVVLDPEQNDMIVRIHWPDQQDQWFILLVPKTFGTVDEILTNHTFQPITWSHRIPGQDIDGVYLDDERFDFRSRVKVQGDMVVVDVEITNTSTEVLRDVWLFTFLAPHGAPDFHDPNGERTYFSLDGTPSPLASVPWPESNRGDVAVYHTATAPTRLPDMMGGIGATATARPDEGWMVATNKTGDAYIAYASPQPLFLFRNRDLSSLHVAPHLGDISPGETVSVTMHALFSTGNLEDGIEAARRHAAQLARSHP
ncbi:MAG: hypothetical protein JJU11_00825 [Candidatus Sumerlaeia bacterium]|nr:hypothetical protein [Candidatus Sumerlaeia bacterium]